MADPSPARLAAVDLLDMVLVQHRPLSETDRLDRLELPAGRVSVTLTVLGLGSEDPEHPWFAGRRGETPRFFYEQPLNVTNAVSVLLL